MREILILRCSAYNDGSFCNDTFTFHWIECRYKQSKICNHSLNNNKKKKIASNSATLFYNQGKVMSWNLKNFLRLSRPSACEIDIMNSFLTNGQAFLKSPKTFVCVIFTYIDLKWKYIVFSNSINKMRLHEKNSPKKKSVNLISCVSLILPSFVYSM